MNGNVLSLYDGDVLKSLRHDFNQIEKTAYGMPREKLDAIQSAPIKREVNKGALTFTTRVISAVGMAGIVASDAKELPPVSIGYKKETTNIYQVGVSYKFTHEELDACAYANIPLSADEAKEARRKIDEKVDELIYNGDADYNIGGLFNNKNVTTSIAADGASGKKTWADKTLDEITADIQTMLNALFEATKGPRGGSSVEPDTIKIPRAAWVSLTNRTKGTDSDVTFLKALQDRFAPQGLKNWECCNSAAGAGVVSGEAADRALIYKKSEENVFTILPVPFRVLPAQYEGLSIIYNCIARCGGAVWRRPTTGVYMDGV